MKSSSLSPSLRVIFKRFKSSAAETLAEVLIALVVISVGAGGAMTLVITSVRANSDAEERLIAYNLAREGVEAVRTIRDTNWLRFPGDRTDCWDVLPDTTSASDCATAEKLGDNTPYLVSPEVDDDESYMAWKIETVGTNDPALYEADLSFVGYEGIIYVHAFNCGGTLCSGDPTIYSREIGIERSASDSLVITATVTWDSHGEARTAVFVDELTNY